MIQIKKLPANKWKDYRDLRLEALQNDPIAFGSSYEEEKKLSEAEWKKRLQNVIFAFVDNKPIGMTVFIFQKSKKIKHIANIYGVYVKKEYRNKGIANKLIKKALSLIKKNKKIIKINGSVNPKQKAALKLYIKHGFKKIGILKKDLYINGKYYDELIMEKFIRKN